MAGKRNSMALVALFAGAIGIAFAPIFVRLSEVGPVATAFWRLALALPLLALWMALQERGRKQGAARSAWPMAVMCARRDDSHTSETPWATTWTMVALGSSAAGAG
mgnify:CR=1 FL=1